MNLVSSGSNVQPHMPHIYERQIDTSSDTKFLPYLNYIFSLFSVGKPVVTVSCSSPVMVSPNDDSDSNDTSLLDFSVNLCIHLLKVVL